MCIFGQLEPIPGRAISKPVKKREKLRFAIGKTEEGCDIFSGKWVRDELTRPHDLLLMGQIRSLPLLIKALVDHISDKVPIGGAYRLIDVPMSNCINSGINKVYILTQFNSASLKRHLSLTTLAMGSTSEMAMLRLDSGSHTNFYERLVRDGSMGLQMQRDNFTSFSSPGAIL
ncbi:hypothetical protein REPUB_Repub11eG0058700 [Reevesia pubescens]